MLPLLALEVSVRVWEGVDAVVSNHPVALPRERLSLIIDLQFKKPRECRPENPCTTDVLAVHSRSVLQTAKEPL
jgi:hypothetical protein